MMLEPQPRELATRFTDTNSYYVSKSSVYRLLKAHDLIGSSAFIVIKATDEFRDKTKAPNQLWQTDFHLSQGHRLGLFERRQARLADTTFPKARQAKTPRPVHHRWNKIDLKAFPPRYFFACC